MKKTRISKSPIYFLYLIPFICGLNRLLEAKNFIEDAFSKKIKMSNLSKTINHLYEENYLKFEKKGKEKLIYINKDQIIKDIFNLFNCTSKFTYKFIIDGKKQIKKKHFTYDKNLKIFFTNNQNLENLFNLFQIYLLNLINSYPKNTFISRNNKELLYKSVLESFIVGIAINDNFFKEYSSYLSQDLILIGVKKFNLEKEFIFKFKKISEQFLIIRNVNQQAIIAKETIYPN